MSAKETPRRRRPIVGPVILIAIGVLFLLNNLGFLSWNFWGTLWQFWPVLLVLLGIELLLGRAHPWVGAALSVAVVAGVVALSLVMSQGLIQPTGAVAGEPGEIISKEADGAQGTWVEIDFGAGEITLNSLPEDSTKLLEAEPASTGRRVKGGFGADTGHLKLRTEGWNWTQSGTSTADRWTVRLARKIPLDLRFKTGASLNTLDLSDLIVEKLRVDTGASSTEIRLPREGTTTASIKVGAADVKVEIPQGTAARIDANVGLGSVNVDEARFPKRGNYYVSSDYETSANRVELDIDGGVASVSVR